MVTNYRLLMSPMKNDECSIVFYEEEFDADNSHRCLLSRIEKAEYTSNVKRDFDKLEEFVIGEYGYGYFGAFYSKMYGNDCKPLLCVYGSSSDYPIKNLTKEALEYYHNALKEYCFDAGYQLLWQI